MYTEGCRVVRATNLPGESSRRVLTSGERFLQLSLGICLEGGSMVVLVMLEETPEHSPVLAQVNSVPSPLSNERPSRDVVTLYGVPSAESLALALATALESKRTAASGEDQPDAVRHLGVWPGRGAVGDAAWRDRSTGQ